MRQLFLFFYNYRAFFTFLFLEVVSAWFIVRNNQYQSSAFYNSANSLAGSVLEYSNEISSYFNLKTVNEDLARENAQLKGMLERLTQKTYAVAPDQLRPEVLNQYNFHMAKIINNTTRHINNFITINKGLNDGLKPGLGVIGQNGVVGKVKNCSNHYSTISSLLNSDIMVSSQIKKSGAFCTTKWYGKNPRKANIIYLPKHIKIAKGDTIITSGYNAVYPYGVLIGVVDEVKTDVSLESTERISIKLSTDFSNLGYVYVVENKLKPELDSLTIKTATENE